MRGPEVLVAMMVMAVPLFAVVAKSDIGRAIADAIRHNSGANEGAAVRGELEQMRSEVEQLRVELDDVHAQLLEAHERLEFAERMLVRPADQPRLVQ